MADMPPISHQDSRHPFHESVCRQVALAISAMSISGGRENQLGVQQVNTNLHLLDRTKLPATELPNVAKTLYEMRAMYGPFMPTVARRLSESLALLIEYQGELVDSGNLDRDLEWLPPVDDLVRA